MLKKIIDHVAFHDHQTVNVSSNFLYCSGENFPNTQLKTILCLCSKTGQRKTENRKGFRVQTKKSKRVTHLTTSGHRKKDNGKQSSDRKIVEQHSGNCLNSTRFMIVIINTYKSIKGFFHQERTGFLLLKFKNQFVEVFGKIYTRSENI